MRKETSPNSILDKLIKQGDKKIMKRELKHYKQVTTEKLFDNVVNSEAVEYSIIVLQNALNKNKLNEKENRS